MAERNSDVYHEGERAVQRRAGVREQAERLADMVGDAVPDDGAVRSLVADQPHAVVTSVDTDGDIWVSFLAGDPGFIDVVDDRTVRFGSDPPAGDPLADHLREGMPAGVLLVDPRTRNRFRLNGTATPLETGFELHTEETFPNCPKYIQKRSFERAAADGEPSPPRRSEGLRPEHRAWIADTDTFFIGSHRPGVGADASHRGGDPGFVEASGDTVRYPDYPGNSMFCTLGNVAANPRVGLCFVDFADGRVLQTTGRAEIRWEEALLADHSGAERLVEITVERAVELPDGNPLRWSLEEFSPFNP